MSWNNEIIVFGCDEKRWNISFFHMFSQRIQGCNVKVVLYEEKSTFSLIVLEMNERAIPEKKDMNPLTNRYASSLHSFYKLLKGESQTIQAISGFLSAYIRAVTAPILLPHSPIELTVSRDLKYWKTVSTSSFS